MQSKTQIFLKFQHYNQTPRLNSYRHKMKLKIRLDTYQEQMRTMKLKRMDDYIGRLRTKIRLLDLLLFLSGLCVSVKARVESMWSTTHSQHKGDGLENDMLFSARGLIHRWIASRYGFDWWYGQVGGWWMLMWHTRWRPIFKIFLI